MYECTRKKIWNEELRFYSELLTLLVDLKFGFSFWEICSDGVGDTVIYYLRGFLVRFTPLGINCRQAVRTKIFVENRNFVYSVSSSVNKKDFKVLIKHSLCWDSNPCLSSRWIFSIIIRKVTSEPPRQNISQCDCACCYNFVSKNTFRVLIVFRLFHNSKTKFKPKAICSRVLGEMQV